MDHFNRKYRLHTQIKWCAGIFATRQKCDRRICDSITFTVAFLNRQICHKCQGRPIFKIFELDTFSRSYFFCIPILNTVLNFQVSKLCITIQQMGWQIFDFQIFSNPTLVKSKNENHQILMDSFDGLTDHKSEDKI